MSQVARDGDAPGLGLSSTPEGGSGCKANKLARLLFLVQIRHETTKQRRNGMGKLTDSQLEQSDQLIEVLKKKLKRMEKQKTCIGGPEVEVRLVKTLDIMRDMEKVEQIKNRMRAKVAALTKGGGANGGNDYGMMEAVLPIIQTALPIVMKMLTAAG